MNFLSKDDKTLNLGIVLNRILKPIGYQIEKSLYDIDPILVYNEDGLRSIHDHEFIQETSFMKAYERGKKATGQDYCWHWRVHIGLWAAYSATMLDGDYVECGVNRGFLSSAIMDYLNWDRLDKTFYLLDTFSGLDERYILDVERKKGILEKNIKDLKSGYYVSNVESVKKNFAEWNNVQIIQGTIPETLDLVDAKKVAYLHIDLNCSIPSVSALDFFWNKLVPGAYVLLDDYAYYGYRNIKLAMDDFVKKKKVIIASLPTGQGLLIKPTK
jgi:hypothetical protein